MILVANNTRIAMTTRRVLLVANRTASDAALMSAVRARALRGPVVLHLVVPATAHGLHRMIDPEEAGEEAAAERLAEALPLLSEAAGTKVTGHVGDANPLDAVSDAFHLQGFDEIIVSTLPSRISRWLRLDLPSKLQGLGVPVLHVTGSETEQLETEMVEVG
jgi:hypothetical protein